MPREPLPGRGPTCSAPHDGPQCLARCGSKSFGWSVAAFEHPAGAARADGSGGDVLHDDGARPHDAEIAHRDARSDEDVSAKPGVLPDDDRLGDEGHAPAVVVVRPRAKVAVLADVRPPA